MKIGIVGIGVVGNALYKSFQNRKLNHIYPYDKFKQIGNISDIYQTDIVFFCLPTPYSYEHKSYDKNAIYEICDDLHKHDYKGLVVVKSTVEPQTCESLSELYNLCICHNPEFLTASTAYEDFENQTHIVIGKTDQCEEKHFNKLEKFYKKYYPNADISKCSSNESELMKLGVNNYYSVKIQFFNELYLTSEKLNNTDFNKVKDLMLKNGWIHPMHTMVPGTDGKLSYGGMCFPKDTNALLQYMKRHHIPHHVLEGVVTERNILRDD